MKKIVKVITLSVKHIYVIGFFFGMLLLQSCGPNSYNRALDIPSRVSIYPKLKKLELDDSEGDIYDNLLERELSNICDMGGKTKGTLGHNLSYYKFSDATLLGRFTLFTICFIGVPAFYYTRKVKVIFYIKNNKGENIFKRIYDVSLTTYEGVYYKYDCRENALMKAFRKTLKMFKVDCENNQRLINNKLK